jgi:predicted anti-sigma-YlaC factor YlaD
VDFTMPDEHVHPNRGWTLLRDAGEFTPAEINHLNNCRECTDWLALFADLAVNAGLHFEVDARFIVDVDQHLRPERGVELIRDGGALISAEQGHLLRCSRCNAWLSGLASIARRSGFTVKFEVPPWDQFQ